MHRQSTDNWALRLHSCRALSSQSQEQHQPGNQKCNAGNIKKCYLCAWEKVLPMCRNFQDELNGSDRAVFVANGVLLFLRF